jgi:hypothetical protein
LAPRTAERRSSGAGVHSLPGPTNSAPIAAAPDVPLQVVRRPLGRGVGRRQAHRDGDARARQVPAERRVRAQLLPRVPRQEEARAGQGAWAPPQPLGAQAASCIKGGQGKRLLASCLRLARCRRCSRAQGRSGWRVRAINMGTRKASPYSAAPHLEHRNPIGPRLGQQRG